MPDSAALIVRVVADGHEEVAMDGARGINKCEEHAGKIEGNRLALARYRGTPINEYLPKKLLRSVDFVLANI